MHARLLAVAALSLLSWWPARASGEPPAMKPGEFLVLAYHAIPARAIPGDPYSVPQPLFAEQMEYLRRHGYQPVSLRDLVEASLGVQELPDKAVLLTFDDAYISYHDFVVPLLQRFGYPSVLAVAGRLIDQPPLELAEPLMNWDQIRAVAGNPLVEIASHSFDLHRDVQYNPAGNVAASASVLAYDPEAKAYENAAAYRARIDADFDSQRKLFIARLGRAPRAIVWPYGRYNRIAWAVAAEHGYQLGFGLEWGLGQVGDLSTTRRIMIENEAMASFIEKLRRPAEVRKSMRAVQIDLDSIFDPDPERMDRRLGELIDRLVDMKVNTVFLQAFADPDGNGTTDSVYFANRVLPVRADFFSHAAHQMDIRGMHVYAWMPSLAIALPDEGMDERFRVVAKAEAGHRLSQSGHARLTPFSGEVRELVGQLYEDLAAHAQIRGVLFQDDVYLTGNEDMHPLAMEEYRLQLGPDWSDPEYAGQRAALRTASLIAFTHALKDRVRQYRPEVRFLSSLDAPTLPDEESESRFTRDYERFLAAYDQVVIMAYPQMEGAAKPSEWLEHIVQHTTVAGKNALEQTVFEVQSFDWRNNTWIESGILLDELKAVIAAGGRHIAYYPDRFSEDRPEASAIKREMSTRDFPYLP